MRTEEILILLQSNGITIRKGACGPVCAFCHSDEDTYLAEAETKTPDGKPIDPKDPEAVEHYWCNNCAGLMVIETGEWKRM
jgi:hypothetical protein